MATSVSEKRSTFVGSVSGLCLFIILLCKGSYGEWRCDKNRRIVCLEIRINT